MKILLSTSIYSPHLIPLSSELAARSHEFRYYATKPPLKWRTEMGWVSDLNEGFFFQLGSEHLNPIEYDQWWDEADVVLCCERDLTRLTRRLSAGKLTFYMTERWWKPPIGRLRLLHPRYLIMAARFWCLSQNPKFHLLGIGHHSLNDLTSLRFFPGRTWEWGYFTQDISPTQQLKGDAFTILYVGRFIPLKRVDTLLKAFARIWKRSPKCFLHLVGSGDCERSYRTFIIKNGLNTCVKITPSLPMPKVWEQMQNSHVLVLPSDGAEGWGAVINEAMSAGCVPVASKQSGAGCTIIRDGVNGRVFESGDICALEGILDTLYSNPVEFSYLSKAARQTITQTWSPKVAADRFLSIAASLLSGHTPAIYQDGPMTRWHSK